MRKSVIVALSAVALLLVPLAPVSAQDHGRPSDRSVSVSASGSAAAAPDRAIITTGVTTDASTAREAMTANSTTMRKLIDGLKALKIDAKDIQTSTIQLNPRYADGRSGKAPSITGYQATNQVRLFVRDLGRLGEVLDAAISLGANQMGGIQFDVSNADQLKDEARKAAMNSARRRADLYATAAGAGLGQVLNISETTTGGQPRVFAGRAAMAEAVAVEPGSLDLTVVVNVTWALK